MSIIDKLVGITAQHNEIVKRVANGSLDPDLVKRALQDIIEKRFHGVPAETPSWWRTPEQQTAKARELWPDIALPEPPTSFVPSTKTEVLLLHVPDTFNSLWNKVVVPPGYTTWRPREFKAGVRTLRLAKNVFEHKAAVWLAFDPEHGKGMRPNELWGKPNLAASEVLSALIQFPNWPLAWFGGASAPNLSGYQYKAGTDWSFVPYLYRWDDPHQLMLHVNGADRSDDRWASPSVREC